MPMSTPSAFRRRGFYQKLGYREFGTAEGFSGRAFPQLADQGAVNVLELQTQAAATESPTEPFKRAVTGCLRAIARKSELEVAFAAERPGVVGGKVRLPEPARKLTTQRSRDRARPCRLDRAQARLSRPERAPQAGAGRADRARGVRCGRAGARRGDRRAPHVRRRQEPDRDARRPLPPRQVRRGHRPRRRADRGRAGHAGARAPHRAGAAGGGRSAWSSSGGR